MIIEFLLALQAAFTLWSQVGGQYHLDLMYWAWKLVIGVGAAALVVAITATLARNGGEISRRVLFFASLLLTLMLLAGILSYYSHINEPADDDEGDAPAATTSLTRPYRNYLREPSAVTLYSQRLSGIPAYSTRFR